MSFWSRMLRSLPYHAAFLGSVNHAWLALVTLGVGVAVATPLSMVLGLGAYGLGVIFLPDLRVFRKGVDDKRAHEAAAIEKQEHASKEQVRAALLQKLTSKARERWKAFFSLCNELQGRLADATNDGLLPDNSLAKVSDSHLLLLAMDADIRGYLNTAEGGTELEGRMETVRTEIAKLRQRKSLSGVEQRLLLSREETLRNLEQQADQNKRMQLNLDLAQSELQRLESQINSLRAELISTPASQLSHRLGDTLIEVEASQRILQEGGMVQAPDLNALLGEHA